MQYLNRIMDNVIGFRSRKLPKMIIAGLYYLMCISVALSNGESWLSYLIVCLLLPVIVFSVIEFKKDKKKKIVSLLVSFILLIVASMIAPVVLPESLDIVGGDIIMEDINETVAVEFKAKPDNASVSSVKLVCEDESIASFKDNVLTSVSEGETQIYAYLPEKSLKSDLVKVVVKDKKAEILRKAKEIEDKINSIGEVTLESKDEIDEVKQIYEAADEEVKNAVSNYNLIAESEEKYSQLEQERLVKEKAEQERLKKEKAEKERVEKEQQIQKQNTQKQSSAQTTSQNSSSSVGTGSKASNSGSSSNSTVYVGKTGEKYHRSGCRTLKGNGTPISYDEAVRQGRTACKVCGG